jgi:hypothetical protein
MLTLLISRSNSFHCSSYHLHLGLTSRLELLDYPVVLKSPGMIEIAFSLLSPPLIGFGIMRDIEAVGVSVDRKTCLVIPL